MATLFETQLPAISQPVYPLERDDVMQGYPTRLGAPTGIYGLFDLPFSYCYPSQIAPVNAALIRDVAGHQRKVIPGALLTGHVDGAFVAQSGQTTAYSGGGFDWTGQTVAGSYINMGATAAASIFTGLNYFMVMGYVRLPTLSNWATTGGFAPFIDLTNSQSYQTQPSLLSMGFNADTSHRLLVYRQTSIGTAASLTLTPLTADFGGMAQVAFWRNAAGTGFRMRTVNGIQQTLSVVGSENSANFSACTAKWGPWGGSFWSLNTQPWQGFAQHRVYRGMIENLLVTGRNPLTVGSVNGILDNDWAMTQQRIAQSAALNGGTSLIFV